MRRFVLLLLDREGVVSHSALLGGAGGGLALCSPSGLRPAFVDSTPTASNRKLRRDRRSRMSLEEFMAEEIDPLLEKISRSGMSSLTRSERRILAEVRERMSDAASVAIRNRYPGPAARSAPAQRWSRRWPRSGCRWPVDAPSLGEMVARFPLGEEALLHLLAVSSVCRARLHPAAGDSALARSDPETCADRRGYGRMITDLRNLVGRDAGRGAEFPAPASLERTGDGADRVARDFRGGAARGNADRAVAARGYLPNDGLRTLERRIARSAGARRKASWRSSGSGKLGGRELNHSSDVDLIFVYSEEGH